MSDYPNCAYNGCMGCSTCSPIQVEAYESVALKEARDTIRRLKQELEEKDKKIGWLTDQLDMSTGRFDF